MIINLKNNSVILKFSIGVRKTASGGCIVKFDELNIYLSKDQTATLKQQLLRKVP